MNDRAEPRRSQARWGFRVAVAVVILLALVVAGLAAWQFWWVGRDAASRAGQAGESYFASCPVVVLPSEQATASLPAPLPDTAEPPEGTTIGLLTLPGSSTQWPIKAGTDDANLDAGVGWYSQTSGPGEVGNMAVVGRRLASGGAFDSILSLAVGDLLTLETCSMVYTYTVTVAPADLTVQPNDVWVLDAVPGQPDAIPSVSWLTLIANQDVISTNDRAVGFAELTSSTPRV